MLAMSTFTLVFVLQGSAATELGWQILIYVCVQIIAV